MEKSLQKAQQKSSLALERFVAHWEQAFERLKRGSYGQDAWWQGLQAYEELCRAPAAQILMFPTRQGSGLDHFQAMMREVESYKKFAADMQETSVNYDDVLRTLTKYEAKFKREQRRAPHKDRNLKKIWLNCAAFMRHQRITARRLLRRRWTVALQSPTRTDWVRSDLTSHTSPLFPHWDTIFSMAQYPVASGRVTDLDARLQIRLATIFRFGLPFVSLRTIGRLVLLAYCCGDLGTVEGTRFLVRDRGTFLSIHAIYKRLKHAGLGGRQHA